VIDLAAIEAAPLVRFVATAPGAWAAVSALHILGIALLVGPIALVDLRLLRLLGPAIDPALPVLVRAAIGGLALAACSGALLAAVQATDYAANPAFLAKLALVGAAVANALALRAVGGVAARRAAPFAAASLVLWLGAVLAGRWIAFA
jgi:hypothetical protein